MKFSALVAIVNDEYEEQTIKAARKHGATGITILAGKGIPCDERKTFFGLSFEGSQTVLLMVLEKSLSLGVLKAIKQVVAKDEGGSEGLVFTVPLEHLAGIDVKQVQRFEQHLKEEL
ncbi:transcriptional regulator [Alkalimonas sp.]|uniref:P-II family nitrogen regulator n=1 Tax=Alkalimonas sp. TaxID=1872453 RepID=UPI00263A5FC6|nr:transcriptional regulator [Alkalimonas sp.]MCC5824739.1 transcriptional regulator [Alkalimonas sp.]